MWRAKISAILKTPSEKTDEIFSGSTCMQCVLIQHWRPEYVKRSRVQSHNLLSQRRSFSDKTGWREAPTYHQKHRIKKRWVTVAKASLRHELLAPEFKDVIAREVANECKDYTKNLSSLKEKQPWSVNRFLKQNRLKWSQDPLPAFVQCSLSGLKPV